MPAVFVPPKMKTASIAANPPVRTRAGVYRWTICALLFLATTINYIDRQTISVLAPDLQHALHWNELDYGNIIAAFQIMYAVGQVLTGFLVDRIGTFAGFAGFILQTTKSYVPLFLIAGTAYLIAFAVIQLLSPSLRPARVEGVEDSET
jgi:MFS transporter, ACS family, hexuronate transporter